MVASRPTSSQSSPYTLLKNFDLVTPDFWRLLTMTTLMPRRPLHFPGRLILAGLVATTILCGCETSRMAFEGNPMPEEQVTKFLQVVSPRSEYDVPPKFRKGYAPFFPEAEGRKRDIGYALAEFVIGTDGRASHVRILKATTYNFAEEAGYTVRDWQFVAAQKNGHPVAVRVRLPFTFRQT